MATLTIKGCIPAQPPLLFLRRRPTIEPTDAPAQDQGPAGGGAGHPAGGDGPGGAP